MTTAASKIKDLLQTSPTWQLTRWALPCAAWLAAAACSDTTPAESIPMKSYRHPIGLRLQAPEAFSAEQTANGYIFKPTDAAKLRSPTQIMAELRTGIAPAGDWPQHRRIKDRTVTYRIDVETGAGSGGDYYTLRAWEPSAKGHVWVEQDVQAETPAEPNFNVAWQIIESIEVEAN